MRICYLGSEDRGDLLQAWATSGVRVKTKEPKTGPKTIESTYEEYLYVPRILELVVEAEREGFETVIMSCFADPGLDAARELVKIPVIGLGESSLLVASMLGHSISILTASNSLVHPLYNLAKIVGVGDKVASVRGIGISVERIRERRDETYQRLYEMGCSTIEEDRADVLVMGCASLSLYADRLQKDLHLPVVHPLRVALKMAELLVSCKLTHSKRAYPAPPSMRV